MTTPGTALHAVIARLQARIAATVPDAVSESGAQLLAEVISRMPRRTGAAARSVTVMRRDRGDESEATVGSQLEYVRWLEHGTGVHGARRRPVVIRARGRALHWGAYGADGRPLFTRRVQVRGVKPGRMFEAAARAVESRLMDRLREVVA